MTRLALRTGILATVEARGVAVVDDLGGRRMFIAYPEAAVWDLVTRRGDGERTRRLIGAIADIGEAEAARLVEASATRWVREGWLE